MTNKLALAVAVILGVLSVVGIKMYVDKVKKDLARDTRELTYLVAARDLEEGEMFTANDIARASFPRAVIESALRDKQIKEGEEASIKSRRTRTAIRQGEILQTHHFNQRSNASKDLAFNNEQRAITIPISKISGVAGMLKPGNYIDLSVTMDLIDRQGRSLTVTRTLFKNVMILATDANTNPFGENAQGYSSLTLRLRPEECNKLLHCLNQGAMLHALLVQEGTSPKPGYDSVTTDDLYREVAPELKR